MINIVKTALQQPTLKDALVYVAIMETERIVKQARENLQWETCFGHLFHEVLIMYGKPIE
jgi:hypothetical protein